MVIIFPDIDKALEDNSNLLKLDLLNAKPTLIFA